MGHPIAKALEWNRGSLNHRTRHFHSAGFYGNNKKPYDPYICLIKVPCNRVKESDQSFIMRNEKILFERPDGIASSMTTAAITDVWPPTPCISFHTPAPYSTTSSVVHFWTSLNLELF
ncbi:hypothetical protein evm_013711 [Chilo suppressalis]|nr:hypothetical protein evm_013711 [Chilo suppressalis]